MKRNTRLEKERLIRTAAFLLLLWMLHAVTSLLTAQTVASVSKPHRLAPNFSRVDLGHQRIELTSYRGKVVLLNFWATWCAPCLVEMPAFTEWQKQYGSEGLQVIGVSMDDATAEVSATVAKLRLSYPVVMGDEHLGAAYGGVLGLPVTFLIDRKGHIQAKYQGATELPHIKADIQSLLKSH